MRIVIEQRFELERWTVAARDNFVDEIGQLRKRCARCTDLLDTSFPFIAMPAQCFASTCFTYAGE